MLRQNNSGMLTEFRVYQNIMVIAHLVAHIVVNVPEIEFQLNQKKFWMSYVKDRTLKWQLNIKVHLHAKEEPQLRILFKEPFSVMEYLRLPLILSYYASEQLELLNDEKKMEAFVNMLFLRGEIAPEKPLKIEEVPDLYMKPVQFSSLELEMRICPEALLDPLCNIIKYFKDASIGDYRSKDALYVLFLSYIGVKFIDFYLQFNQEPDKNNKNFYLNLISMLKDNIEPFLTEKLSEAKSDPEYSLHYHTYLSFLYSALEQIDLMLVSIAYLKTWLTVNPSKGESNRTIKNVIPMDILILEAIHELHRHLPKVLELSTQQPLIYSVLNNMIHTITYI